MNLLVLLLLRVFFVIATLQHLQHGVTAGDTAAGQQRQQGPRGPPLVRRLQATYQPGDFSQGNVIEDTVRGTKIFLSNGLAGRAIAHNSEPLIAADGTTQLAEAYHEAADGGATFPKKDGSGGYYYVSNSEHGAYPDIPFVHDLNRAQHTNTLTGGAHSLEFNKNHELIGYRQVLAGTALNCAGGTTPWNTWVSCEETRQWGRCWQVDPAGEIEAKATNVTGLRGIPEYGNFEAFAWDSTSIPPHGYVTDDDTTIAGLPSYRGAVIRFTPDKAGLVCLNAGADADNWCALDSGTHEYLKLNPDNGTFTWVSDPNEANPDLYQGSEGIHVEDGILTFSAVVERNLFRLYLKNQTYVKRDVPFPQEPDNLRILDGVLYLCTDGDHDPGDAVWGWDDVGAWRVFYEEGHNYPAGVAFSPDAKYMYTSMWGEATWRFWREDGLNFNDETAGINYEVMGGLDAVATADNGDGEGGQGSDGGGDEANVGDGMSGVGQVRSSQSVATVLLTAGLGILGAWLGTSCIAPWSRK